MAPMQVIEHVKRPDEFCRTLAGLLREGDPRTVLVVSTLNRTVQVRTRVKQ